MTRRRDYIFDQAWSHLHEESAELSEISETVRYFDSSLGCCLRDSPHREKAGTNVNE